MKTLILEKCGYIIKGTADLNLWGGGKGSIKMTSFAVNSLKDIEKNLNDSGFGVEKINGAIVDVYDNFVECLKYRRTLTIGKVSDNTVEAYYND